MTKKCIICGAEDFKIKSERFCSQKCIHIHGARHAHNNKIICEFCNKEIQNSNYKTHLKTHEIKQYHYFCENCGKECFDKYGSCRFCSNKCAKGFSTKEKRKEINEKVKIALTGFKYINKKKTKTKKLEYKLCPVCNESYLSNRKTCSNICRNIHMSNITTGIPHKPIKDSSKMGGLRPGGGKSKQLPYINWLGFKMSLNKEEIKVAEILDNLKLNWNRNTKGFSYITLDGKQRKFYPDFVINGNLYLEYKGWITKEMEHKMKTAKIDNLIIVVGEDKRYKHMGISLNDLKYKLPL